MMNIRLSLALRAFFGIAVLTVSSTETWAEGDPVRGKREFLACVMCHSADPSVHKTGPSLATVWGRKAGMVENFSRYSDAIKSSDVIWDSETLDVWLRDPQSLIPGTSMRIRGLVKPSKREDIIAYLQQLASGRGMPSMDAPSRGDPADLSKAPRENQVTAISHCRDTYRITTASDKTLKYWEFNLRLKTDTSAKGPPKGRPVLVGSGMRGDRASLVFASPAEISPFIKEEC